MEVSGQDRYKEFISHPPPVSFLSFSDYRVQLRKGWVSKQCVHGLWFVRVAVPVKVAVVSESGG